MTSAQRPAEDEIGTQLLPGQAKTAWKRCLPALPTAGRRRQASVASRLLLVAEGDHGVHFGRAAGGDIACQQRHRR